MRQRPSSTATCVRWVMCDAALLSPGIAAFGQTQGSSVECLIRDKTTASSIRHSTFEDFAGGTLGNSGANLYVSRNGRVQVINRRDINRDGSPDIIFCNYIHNYPGVRSAYVYWGSREGYDPRHRTELPTNWAAGVAAADLNGDGYPDLVFANQGVEAGLEDIRPDVGLDSYVYWGGASGFGPARRSLLPTRGARDVALGDFNKDGHPDIAFASSRREIAEIQIFWGGSSEYDGDRAQSLPVSGPTSVRASDVNGDGYCDLVVAAAREALVFVGGAGGFDPAQAMRLSALQAEDCCIADLDGDGFADIAVANSSDGKASDVPSYLYWGSMNGFAAERRLELPTLGAMGIAASDLDSDGHMDLIFANSNDGTTYDVPSYVYWGSEQGFAPYLRSELQSFGCASVNVADLNGDGRLDFVVGGGFDPEKRSYNTRTRIFWGAADGTPSPDGVVEMEAYGTIECGIADLNRDGHLDLVLSNYMSDSTRSLPVFIYWGSESGYSEANRTDLPGQSAAGIQTIDLNRDGYPEIVVHNHLKDGDHSISSYIYWNGPQGFDMNRRTELPVFGPHYSPMTDPGNLYTRRLEGEYVSAPVRLPAGKRAARVSWQCDEPHGSKVKFQFRAAPTVGGLRSAKWAGPAGEGTFYESPGADLAALTGTGGWVQYRAVFTSPDGGDWPTLTEVEIGLR